MFAWLGMTPLKTNHEKTQEAMAECLRAGQDPVTTAKIMSAFRIKMEIGAVGESPSISERASRSRDDAGRTSPSLLPPSESRPVVRGSHAAYVPPRYG